MSIALGPLRMKATLDILLDKIWFQLTSGQNLVPIDFWTKSGANWRLDFEQNLVPIGFWLPDKIWCQLICGQNLVPFKCLHAFCQTDTWRNSALSLFVVHHPPPPSLPCPAPIHPSTLHTKLCTCSVFGKTCCGHSYQGILCYAWWKCLQRWTDCRPCLPSYAWCIHHIFPSVKFHHLRSSRVDSWEEGQCIKMPASTFWGSFGVTDLWLSVKTDNLGVMGWSCLKSKGLNPCQYRKVSSRTNPLLCTVYRVNLPHRHYGILLCGSAKFVVLWKDAPGREKSTKKVIEGRFLCDGYTVWITSLRDIFLCYLLGNKCGILFPNALLLKRNVCNLCIL